MMKDATFSGLPQNITEFVVIISDIISGAKQVQRVSEAQRTIQAIDVKDKGRFRMDKYRVKPGKEIELKEWDPRDTGGYDGGKNEAKEELVQLTKELEELQELLYAEGNQRLLLILQGMDTSGKDGVVRHVFEGVNPQGVRVANFKVPTPLELAHDYLWRVHAQTPARGEIVIFNRSHYEDVLVVRVHELVSKKIWVKRFRQINEFERQLAEEGTTILKFFLHISMDEQKERLQSRLEDSHKHWKFNPNDLKERGLWDEYTQAYEDVLNKTSTRWAPWYIIPADRKWYRNLIIGRILVSTLKKFKMKYPALEVDPATITIE
jgi:PPK2 family polyphosphate:nucleotide phosphotransferase